MPAGTSLSRSRERPGRLQPSGSRLRSRKRPALLFGLDVARRRAARDVAPRCAYSRSPGARELDLLRSPERPEPGQRRAMARSHRAIRPSCASTVTPGHIAMFRTACAIAFTTSTASRADTAKGFAEHLVPLEIGGANDVRNLWPQSLGDSKRKDEVEDALRVAVCVSHTLTLASAQAAIARNWTATPVGLPAVRARHYVEDERW